MDNIKEMRGLLLIMARKWGWGVYGEYERGVIKAVI